MLLACSTPRDTGLEEALAIREQVCACTDQACFEATTAALWAPFAEGLQAWWNDASPPDRNAMEEIVRDIDGLCQARADFSR